MILNSYFKFLVPAPSAPTIKNLLPLNHTSVKIIWMIENNINEGDYVTIQYMYAGPCNFPDQTMCTQNQLNETSSANYSIISDLQEHSTYLFKITAYNSAGPSASNERNVTTLSAGNCLLMYIVKTRFDFFYSAPSGAPESLNITASNLTSITITWDEVQCINRNSDITGYVIKFNGRSNTTNMRQFIASGLFPSTTYTFQIAAMSSNGTGQPFGSINASTSSPKGNCSLYA
jgi:hypothetical protein